MSNHPVVWLRLALVSLWLIMVSLVLLTRVVLPGYAAEGPPARPLGCDQASLSDREDYFQRLSALHSRQLAWVSAAELRVAALNYIAGAEACYQAMLPLAQENEVTLIDEGGRWAPGSAPGGDLTGQAVLADTKWPGGKFNVDQPPGTAGGLVTYSYMAAGISHAVEHLEGIFDPQPNVDVRTGLGVDGCVKEEIRTAFNAWAAVADIQFAEVADSGLASDAVGAGGDIRIGAHTFFNPTRLAHAFFPPPNGISLAGDLHFNRIKNWVCSDPQGDEVDIGLVALHEIGHAIGLDHEPPAGAIAVMNATFNPGLTVLQPDDIAGVESIYGGRDIGCAEPVPISSISASRWLTDTLVGTTTWQTAGTDWVVINAGTQADAVLVSPLLTVPDDRIYGTLTFSHAYTLPQTPFAFYDGGTLEISSTKTMTWTQVSQFIKNGYNGQIIDIFGEAIGNPLAGEWAFSGKSGRAITSVADLANFLNLGDQFQLRFRFGADNLAVPPSQPGGEWRLINLDRVSLCRSQIYYYPIIFKSGNAG